MMHIQPQFAAQFNDNTLSAASVSIHTNLRSWISVVFMFKHLKFSGVVKLGRGKVCLWQTKLHLLIFNLYSLNFTSLPSHFIVFEIVIFIEFHLLLCCTQSLQIFFIENEICSDTSLGSTITSQQRHTVLFSSQ